eukprot:1835916-Rhodomonas_salina.1
MPQEEPTEWAGSQQPQPESCWPLGGSVQERQSRLPIRSRAQAAAPAGPPAARSQQHPPCPAQARERSGWCDAWQALAGPKAVAARPGASHWSACVEGGARSVQGPRCCWRTRGLRLPLRQRQGRARRWVEVQTGQGPGPGPRGGRRGGGRSR